MFKVDNLSFAYHQRTILDRLSFSFERGELLSICGNNGAGKSTLLKILSGDNLLGFHQGSISLDGLNIENYEAKELAKRRAVLAQSYQVNFNFSVKEIVGLSVYVGNTKQQSRIILEALDAVDMMAYENRSFPSLSGGEKQKIQLARVLAQLKQFENEVGPGFIFLDEPTSALDLKNQHIIFDYLFELRDKGYGVLAIIHDLNLACNYSDRIIFLKNGKIFADGKVDEICNPFVLTQVYEHPVDVIQGINGKPVIVPVSNSKSISIPSYQPSIY